MNNPYVNALLASGYIVAITLGIIVGGKLAGPEDNILAPMIMLSMLVLSVATMGFLFFYRPMTLLLDGQRAQALSFFARMLGTFAVLTALVIATAFIFFP